MKTKLIRAFLITSCFLQSFGFIQAQADEKCAQAKTEQDCRKTQNNNLYACHWKDGVCSAKKWHK